LYKERDVGMLSREDTVTTNKTEVKDAAWYYAEPLKSMEKIRGYVAFYKGKAEVKST
jgi:uncharacterized protein (DUF427 family)